MTSVMGGVTSLVGGINMLTSGINILSDKSKPLGKRLLSGLMMALPGITMLTGGFSKLGKGFVGLGSNLQNYAAKRAALNKINKNTIKQIGEELVAKKALENTEQAEQMMKTKKGKEDLA